MNRAGFIHLVIAAVFGACLAIVLLAIVSLANAGGGFTLATVATSRGWLIPLVSGVASGLLAWALLQPRVAEKHRAAHGRRPSCPICGESVGGDWRLCPHCGEIIR